MSDTRVAFSWPLYGLLQCIYMLGYTSRQSWYRPLFFIPVFLISYHLVFRSTPATVTVGNLSVDFWVVIPTQLAVAYGIPVQLAFAYDYLVLTDIQAKFYRVGERPGQISSASFKERLAWACHLHVSWRGVGWGHELLHVPKGPPSLNSPHNKKAFIISRIRTTCKWVAVQLMAMVVNAANPVLVPGASRLHTQSLYMKAVSTLGSGIFAVAQLCSLHCIASIIMVGTGFTQPADWPPLFGSPLNMYTVQSFWRNTWHQLIRRPLLRIANFVAHDVLRIRRTEKSHILLAILKIQVAFLVSALIHVGAEFMMNGRGGSGVFIFFVLQGLAVSLEITIQYILTGSMQPPSSDSRPALIWRLFGYIYVFCWLFITTPLAQQGLVDAGVFMGGPVPALSDLVSKCLAFDVI